MKSLRLRLALISAAISGLVITGFGLAGWFVTSRILQESIDLRLSVPLDRIIRDLHPRTDFERITANLEIGFGEDVAAGTQRILLINLDGSEIYRAPQTDWVAKLDQKLVIAAKPAPPEVAHTVSTGEAAVEQGYQSERETEDKASSYAAPSEREWQDFFADFVAPDGGREGRPPRREHGPPEGRSGPPNPNAHGPPDITFSTHSDAGGKWRIGMVEDRGYIALMAAELSAYQAEMNRVRNLFFMALPVCLLVIGLGGWFVARRALRPVNLIAKIADRVTTARGLDQRIPKGIDDYEELSRLVDVLNAMMDRLDSSFRHAMRFSADVSHELKTPLAVMQVAVQDALKDCPSGSTAEENLLTVSQEVERLKRITRSLMMLAQADAGQLQVRRETFLLSREVEAICEDAEILCEEADLEFQAEIDPDIEASADPVLLRQAMQNLVSNAVKYNHSGGSVACRLYRFEDASEVVFEVTNTGPGIGEEDESKIFERFYRVDQSRSRDVDGFGLGLNLAREIVRAMDGELLLVKSGDGLTRFQVRLKQ